MKKISIFALAALVALIGSACLKPLEFCTITVNADNAAMGSVSGGGTFTKGATTTISATPASGYIFSQWNDGNRENPRNITVTGDATYTAYFTLSGGGGGNNNNSTWSGTFDGAALDIAGYSDLQYGTNNGTLIWLVQFARQGEGTTVYFPYICAWFSGNSSSSFTIASSVIAYPLELYKDTYYIDNDNNNYGDWQFYSLGYLHCTAFDLTAHKISFSLSCSMYSLGEIVDGTHTEASDCTKKMLTLTGSNLVFTQVE